MRALVTFAHKSRWLPRQADPMWLVRYSAKPEYEGQASGYVPRDALPTDDDCAQLFTTMAAAGYETWALAMRLKHRCGARWGELIALRASDIAFEPHRSVRIERAVEQAGTGKIVKGTKNSKKRSSIFPASLADDLRSHVEEIIATRGQDGLLFPGRSGYLADRNTFRRIWARAAIAADWPMKSPTAARWHPHDLRHVAACWMLFDVQIDPAVVCVLLGHANPAFTLSRYVGVRGHIAPRLNEQTAGW
jgi:integrase